MMIDRWLRLPDHEQGNRWCNEDTLPVPPERQVWGPLQFIELWFVIFTNLSNYQTGSSLMASGLLYWQAILVIIIGNILGASFAVLNSVSGAALHIGFPIASRSVWGLWGSYFPILNRILLSLVWYGVQAVLGGKMLYHMAAYRGRHTESLASRPWLDQRTICMLLLVQHPHACLIWIRPHKIRVWFHYTAVIISISLFVLLGWAVATSKGWGEVITAKSTISRAELGWTMSAGVMSVIGSISAGILNQSDFTRFAKKPSHVTWSQAGSFFVASNITSIIGVIVTAATQEEYGHGKALWDPTQLFMAIQDQHGSRGRAAAFFLGLVFIISQLGINVVGNVLAGGLDVAAVLPKYINLRRGAYTIAVLSVLPNPWQQLASGSTFLAVLSAYAVFLGPMIGLLCVHYYIIQKRTFHFPDLYTGNKKSIYWYTWGVNWRTVLVWLIAIVPSFPGFVNDANPALPVPIGLTHVYSLSFVLGFLIAVVLALLLHWIFPENFPERTELEQEQDLYGTDISFDYERQLGHSREPSNDDPEKKDNTRTAVTKVDE
ncbi:Transporter aclS [Pseudocercospora fuligena]|uniref:Transporter aclS n=1 Tax=Pseudocercospora fuligena TaxID=685502 RepID=A0A8H6R3V3_9PEZI|nr:Transporter aclS [Pseudocercospora fuligena]